MADAAQPSEETPKGASLLPPRRTAAELATKPPITDLSVLVIDDLTDEEYEAFLDAVTS